MSMAEETLTAEAGAPPPDAPPANQETEAKTEEGAEDAKGTLLSDGDGKESASTANVPEDYTFELPEGLTLNEAQTEAFKAQAKELGLSQEQANKMLALHQKNQNAAQQAHYSQVQSWADEVRNDKDMGGTKFDATVMYAKDGLKRFDESGELFKVLDSTGYGSNPHVIRFLAAIGKAHAEDSLVNGKDAVQEKPRHERLYGKYNK